MANSVPSSSSSLPVAPPFQNQTNVFPQQPINAFPFEAIPQFSQSFAAVASSSRDAHANPSILQTEKGRKFVLKADDLQRPQSDVNLTVVMKSIGRAAPIFEVLLASLKASWGDKCPFHLIQHSASIFTVRFFKKDDKDMVLMGGPWNNGHDLLLFEQFPTKVHFLKTNFQFSFIWVRVLDLPIQAFSKEAAEHFGSLFGGLIQVDLPESDFEESVHNTIHSTSIREYLRIKVKIDISQPLLRTYSFEIQNANGDMEDIDIRFQYENVPDICFACGKIGHVFSNCDTHSNLPVENHPYEDWIKAPDWVSKLAISSKKTSLPPRTFKQSGRGRSRGGFKNFQNTRFTSNKPLESSSSLQIGSTKSSALEAPPSATHTVSYLNNYPASNTGIIPAFQNTPVSPFPPTPQNSVYPYQVFDPSSQALVWVMPPSPIPQFPNLNVRGVSPSYSTQTPLQYQNHPGNTFMGNINMIPSPTQNPQEHITPKNTRSNPKNKTSKKSASKLSATVTDPIAVDLTQTFHASDNSSKAIVIVEPQSSPMATSPEAGPKIQKAKDRKRLKPDDGDLEAPSGKRATRSNGKEGNIGRGKMKA